MRRLGLLCGVLVVMAIFLVPSMAQSRAKSITDIVDNGLDPALQFTILQELLEAAPRVRNRLDRQGQFTLFAPDDNAFIKMEDFTGLTADDILSDRELLNAILNYHIIDRPLSAEQLRLLDGNFLQTTFSDTPVEINLTPDNNILLNQTVRVISENIEASNGYIHVVDDVLSNAIIIDIVEENAAESIQPETTPASVTVEQVQDIVANTANVRIAHFSVDAPDINVILNDEIIFEESAYGTVSDFAALPQGIYTATIESADFTRQFEISLDLTVLNGDFVTIFLVGSYTDSELEVVSVQEDFSAPDDDESGLTLYNTVQGSPSVNLLLGDAIIFESVSYTDLERGVVDAGDYALSLVQTRDASPFISDSDSLTLAESSFYLMIIHGTVDEPILAIVENSAAEILELQNEESDSSDGNGGTSSSGSDTLDIVDVLDERDDFTLLIRVVAVLGEEDGDDRRAVDILGNVEAEPVTFLAPDDRAFENLLATIGYSENRFLADTDLLSSILLYHITDTDSGVLTANQFREEPGSYVTQLSLRDAFFVRVGSDNSIIVNGFVEIVESDIQAANGIIHIVDNVLLPQNVLDELGL